MFKEIKNTAWNVLFNPWICSPAMIFHTCWKIITPVLVQQIFAHSDHSLQMRSGSACEFCAFRTIVCFSCFCAKIHARTDMMSDFVCSSPGPVFNFAVMWAREGSIQMENCSADTVSNAQMEKVKRRTGVERKWTVRCKWRNLSRTFHPVGNSFTSWCSLWWPTYFSSWWPALNLRLCWIRQRPSRHLSERATADLRCLWLVGIRRRFQINSLGSTTARLKKSPWR